VLEVFDVIPDAAQRRSGTQCLCAQSHKGAGSRVSLRDWVCRTANASAEGGAEREYHGWHE